MIYQPGVQQNLTPHQAAKFLLLFHIIWLTRIEELACKNAPVIYEPVAQQILTHT